MTQLTPQEIVFELDKHIVGQGQAKKAVAIALRNRWRRAQVGEPLRQEITPKNILMIGPTGVGKTEIARRLARLAQRAVHQDRGDQVHRSRLRRSRCRNDYPRPRRDRHQERSRPGAQSRSLARRRCRRGAPARLPAAGGARHFRRRSGRRRGRNAPEVSQEAARGQPGRQRDRDRARRSRRCRPRSSRRREWRNSLRRSGNVSRTSAGRARKRASSGSARRANC